MRRPASPGAGRRGPDFEPGEPGTGPGLGAARAATGGLASPLQNQWLANQRILDRLDDVFA